MTRGILCDAGSYRSGDPPPTGYIAWHEWAMVQHKAGLRQHRCGICGKWHYPQELSGKTVASQLFDFSGNRHALTWPVCLKCDADADGPAKRRAP